MIKINRLFSALLDNFRLPSQADLSRYFGKISGVFNRAQKSGQVTYRQWYSDGDKGELTQNPSGKLQFKTAVLELPGVSFKGRNYTALISRTTDESQFFPDSDPEVTVGIFELALSMEAAVSNTVRLELIEKRYNSDPVRIIYEIVNARGPSLTASGFTFISSVFDKAIGGLYNIDVDE